MRRAFRNERGAALLETAITLPIILLVSVGIFEFGRAFQVQQVLTNAAREGARVSIIATSTDDDVRAAVTGYMRGGGLPDANVTAATVSVVREDAFVIGGATASKITVTYPFQFIVLKPVARLINRTGTLGDSVVMTAIASMRNEG
jgi:Flp pilus assembly protein TadG